MTSSTPVNEGSPALSVIAPCFNEEANVDLLVHRTMATFDRMGIAAELVLVDDGSRDRTWERIQACSAEEPRVRGVRHDVNRGMEQAWHTGLAAARSEVVCLIDADLQNRPEDIATLHAAYTEGLLDSRSRPAYDIIQAVRHSVELDSPRKLFTRSLNHMLNCLFRTRARDSKSGFVVCRREVLADVLRHRFRYRYYQSFLGVAANWRGYRIGEVDTVFDARHAGTSFIQRPLAVSLRICWEVVKFRYELTCEGHRAGEYRHVWADAPSHGPALCNAAEVAS